MKPSVRPALEAFRAAQDARRRDMRDTGKAEALVEARRVLDRELEGTLARVPYGARKVMELRPPRGGGHIHLAVTEPVRLGAFRRERGQTLCGAAPGRAAADRAPSCDGCLQLLDRHVGLEQDQPTLL